MTYTEITDPSHRCTMGASCPGIWKSDDGKTYRITGRLTAAVTPIEEEPRQQYEATVEIDAGLLEASLGASLRGRIDDEASLQVQHSPDTISPTNSEEPND